MEFDLQLFLHNVSTMLWRPILISKMKEGLTRIICFTYRLANVISTEGEVINHNLFTMYFKEQLICPTKL